MRDLRDPELLGAAYALARQRGATPGQASRMQVANYADGPSMSSRPEQHHSQTPQDQGVVGEPAHLESR